MMPLYSIVIVKPCYRDGQQDVLFNEWEDGDCRKSGTLTVSKPLMYVKKFKALLKPEELGTKKELMMDHWCIPFPG
jgi:hypothetical protein